MRIFRLARCPERQIPSNIYLWISDTASDEAVCLSHNRPRHNMLAESTMSSVVFSHPLTTQISLIWIISNVISGFYDIRQASSCMKPFPAVPLLLLRFRYLEWNGIKYFDMRYLIESLAEFSYGWQKKEKKKCLLIFIRSVCVCPWNRIVRLTALWMKLVDGNCVIRIVSHQYWCKLESFNLESLIYSNFRVKKIWFLSTTCDTKTSSDSEKSFASKLST